MSLARIVWERVCAKEERELGLEWANCVSTHGRYYYKKRNDGVWFKTLHPEHIPLPLLHT